MRRGYPTVAGSARLVGVGKTAHLLVGSLAHSRWRAVLAPAEDQPHLIEALDAVVRRLGGLTHRWRFDRWPTVCHPDSGLTATFGRSRRTTRSGSLFARRVGATARAWWRRRT